MHTTTGACRWLRMCVCALLMCAARSGDVDERIRQATSALLELGKGMTAYMVDYGGVPVDVGLQDVLRGDKGRPGLASYVKFGTVDPWGSPWSYRAGVEERVLVANWAEEGIARWVTPSYTMTSPGPDRQLGTADDIVLKDGLIVAIPEGLAWTDVFPGQGTPETEHRATALSDILQEMKSGMPARLEEIKKLREAPELLRDAWGTPWRYKSLEGVGFEFVSAGSDVTFGTGEDYVVSWMPERKHD